MCCFVRTDGRTDGHTDIKKLVVAFRNFENVPEMVSFTLYPAMKFQTGSGIIITVQGVNFTQKLYNTILFLNFKTLYNYQ
jgi:hypothetical protein